MYFIYHPKEGKQLVNTKEEYISLMSKGWYDTPAKFPSNKSKEKLKRGRPPKTSDSEVKEIDNVSIDNSSSDNQAGV